jgi:hypothetical protein
MLGQHMSFSDWVSATDSKDSSIAFRKEILTANGTEPGDFKVPLTEALEIAKREGGPAGELVSILIRDGGFLHGGPVTEPIDSTLRRLQGLMPDHLGRVSARCVHKFTNKGEPFEAWVEAEEKSGSENSTLRDELISLDEAEIRGIWDTNTRYYCEMWCPSYPA